MQTKPIEIKPGDQTYCGKKVRWKGIETVWPVTLLAVGNKLIFYRYSDGNEICTSFLDKTFELILEIPEDQAWVQVGKRYKLTGGGMFIPMEYEFDSGVWKGVWTGSECKHAYMINKSDWTLLPDEENWKGKDGSTLKVTEEKKVKRFRVTQILDINKVTSLSAPSYIACGDTIELEEVEGG